MTADEMAVLALKPGEVREIRSGAARRRRDGGKPFGDTRSAG
jgi:hypothetical protein